MYEGGAHVGVRRGEGDGAEREGYPSALVRVLRAGDQRQVREGGVEGPLRKRGRECPLGETTGPIVERIGI